MTMEFRHFVTRIANLLGVVALLTSCAPDPNLPTAEMTEAEKAIEQAEKAGARRFAQLDYEEAQAAYKQAEDAHRHGDHALATAQAMRSADVAARAASLASNAETQRAATEVRKSAESKRTAEGDAKE
jgi:hypothetical protein